MKKKMFALFMTFAMTAMLFSDCSQANANESGVQQAKNTNRLKFVKACRFGRACGIYDLRNKLGEVNGYICGSGGFSRGEYCC